MGQKFLRVVLFSWARRGFQAFPRGARWAIPFGGMLREIYHQTEKRRMWDRCGFHFWLGGGIRRLDADLGLWPKCRAEWVGFGERRHPDPPFFKKFPRYLGRILKALESPGPRLGPRGGGTDSGPGETMERPHRNSWGGRGGGPFLTLGENRGAGQSVLEG